MHAAEEEKHEGWRSKIPEHLPMIHKRKRLEICDNNGTQVKVDSQLVEWIGPSLHGLLKSMFSGLLSSVALDAEQSAKLCDYLSEIVEMTTVVHHRGLRWYGDVDTGNICRGKQPERGIWACREDLGRSMKRSRQAFGS